MRQSGFLFAVATILTTLATPATAQEAFARFTTALLAGPGPNYPQVDVLRRGDQVWINGCLPGFTWCDVSVEDERGWVDADSLEVIYQRRRVLVPQYAPVIGLPIIAFSLGNYWDRHYRRRPWYRERYRFERGPGRAPGFEREPERSPRFERSPGVERPSGVERSPSFERDPGFERRPERTPSRLGRIPQREGFERGPERTPDGFGRGSGQNPEGFERGPGRSPDGFGRGPGRGPEGMVRVPRHSPEGAVRGRGVEAGDERRRRPE